VAAAIALQHSEGTNMSDQSWYVYQNSQQLGPYTSTQVTQLLANKMIAQEAYLFKVGWKDWRPLEDTYEELGMPNSKGPATIQRRTGAPRATVQGRVIVHNDGQLVIGSGVNISSTGIFVESTDEIFTVGESLKLSVRCEGIAKPFNAVAQVIRYNSDTRYAVGYGLKFLNLDDQVEHEIERLVGLQNAKDNPSKAAR